MFEDFSRQFKALAWKNAILKTRYWGTLCLEIIVPVISILGSVVLARILPMYDYGLSVPNSATNVQSFRVSDSYNVFGRSMCGRYQNIVWNCGQSFNSSECSTSFTTAYSANIARKCQPRYIAVAPADGSIHSSNANSSAFEFVKWMNNNTIFRSYKTFVYFPSETAFTNYMSKPGYAIDPTINVYSSAVIFSSGSPHWSYSLRMNQSFTDVSIILVFFIFK